MTFLLVLMLPAAILWMIPLVRRGRMTELVAAVLVTGTVTGPFFFAIDGPIQISIDRILWAMVWGFAIVQWRLGNVLRPAMTWIDTVVIAATIYFLVSSLRGDAPSGTGAPPTARWLFYVAMPAGTYFMIRLARFRTGDLTTAMRVWIGLGLYLAVTALLEVKGYRSLVFPKYINDPVVWEFFGRGRGPLLNPIGNGAIMSGALLAAVMQWARAGRIGKLGWAVASLVLLLGVYATLTRSCWVGAVGALAIYGWISSPKWLRIWSIAAGGIMMVALTMGLKDELMSFKRDKDLSAAEAAKSVELRPLLAVVAFEMFKHRPIVGHGFGHYLQHNDPYHNSRKYDLPLETVREYVQHNTFLSVLVDGGSIGLLLFVLPVVGCGAAAIRILVAVTRRRVDAIAQPQSLSDQNNHVGPSDPSDAIGRFNDERKQIAILLLGWLVIYAANGMFHDMIVIPMVQMFSMTLLGLMATAERQSVPHATSRPLPPRIFETTPPMANPFAPA